jgi:membrane-associated phospholipid phosphatase
MRFFLSLFCNMGQVFSGRNLLWHLVAIVLTYILVVSGFDWFYFVHTRGPEVITILFPAVILGAYVPIFLPLFLLAGGYWNKSANSIRAGWILIQAQLIAELVSFFYKALTGRVSVRFAEVGTDTSRMFRFGFLRGGVFWGWPSSHTTLAFATAFTMMALFPRSKTIRILMLAYAFYIGIGVSVTIHWFSEFVAGGIFGTLVAAVVAKNTLGNKAA